MRTSTVLQMLAILCLASSAAHAEEPAATKLEKPKTVTREEWGSEPQPLPDSRKHTPQFITLHHGGTDWKAGRDPAQFVRNLQKYGQREKNWPDLPYHFMIAPDGRIFECRPIEYEPESNTKYDLQGHIGVELMGNFETQRPSPAQLKSTVALVAWLCQDLRIDASQIAGHGDRAKKQTVCPGKDFARYLEDGQLVGWVKETLAGNKPDVKPGEPLNGGPTVVVDTPAESAKGEGNKGGK